MSDLEREYSPSSRVGGSSAPFVADYVARSQLATAELGDRLERLPGGSLLVHAGGGSPLLVFIHGGYWQALSAEASMYLAPGALEAGWSYAALEYTLAPEGRLPDMVGECAEALAALAALGSWPSVVLAGHSAGAHLAAMAALASRPALEVERLVLVSGVYDLRPLVHTTVNDPLGLDEASAAACSPALLPLMPNGVDVMVTWGDDDTDAFREQGHDFAERLRSAGAVAHELECEGRHHFDIVDELVRPAHPLGAYTLGTSAVGGHR